MRGVLTDETRHDQRSKKTTYFQTETSASCEEKVSARQVFVVLVGLA